MFSSDFDNEVCNAARMAETLRKRSGMTWSEILRPVPELRHERVIETFEDAIELCQAYADRLTAWERNFVATLGLQRSPISPKQIAILDQILAKIRVSEARAAA